MTTSFRLAAGAAIVLIAACAQAQTPAPAPVPPVTHGPAMAAPAPAAAPQANPADVASIDSIMAALYDVISGPVGKQRDWNRFHSLFAPGARMMAIGMKPDGTVVHRPMTPAEYVEKNEKGLMDIGFFESEKARTVEQFGELAHVFTTYEARKGSMSAEPFMRGINSVQLISDGKRWYIANVIWRAEDAKLKLPARYLQSR